ncbi:urea active transporter, partial [Biomphalaria glabrata]
MIASINASDVCQGIWNSSNSLPKETGIQPLIEMYEICLILLATGVLAFLIARGFKFIRQHVYRDD